MNNKTLFSLINAVAVVLFFVIVFSKQTFSQYPKIYFGDLHSHTSFSDGKLGPNDAFRQAKNSDAADFFAVTDHSWYGKQLWDSLDISSRNNTTSKFVAIRGFEFTQRCGHIDIYNTDWFIEGKTLNDIYEALLKDTGSIAQWNHPGQYEGEFENYGHYSAELDKIINLMEIMNLRRNKIYEDYYVRALEKGWHISPTANSDMHETNWITGYDWRTAILADTLSEKGIYSAIKKRRTYATEDRNVRLYYTINDSLMGSIIKKPTSIRLNVDVSDPDVLDPLDKIALVEIVSRNGSCIKSKSFNSHKVKWRIKLKVTNKSDTYFYVRVTNAESQLVVSAPIWIDFGKGLKDPYVSSEQISVIDKLETYRIYDLSGRTVRNCGSQKIKLLSKIHSGVYVNSSGIQINYMRD